jgi:hypothetical protein
MLRHARENTRIRVHGHRHRRLEQMLRGPARPAGARVHGVELWRQLGRTASTTGLIRRIGGSNGIRLSVVRADSIVAWQVVVPRMRNLRKLNMFPEDSHTRVTLSRVSSGPENQHPAKRTLAIALGSYNVPTVGESRARERTVADSGAVREQEVMPCDCCHLLATGHQEDIHVKSLAITSTTSRLCWRRASFPSRPSRSRPRPAAHQPPSRKLDRRDNHEPDH